MLVINAVYRFGYCRTLCPLALYLALYLPLPARPPPDGSVFIAARRDARLNPRRSIYLFPATGIDPIDRQQPAVFIFIGTADSTEKKERKKKKRAKLQQQPIYRGNARPEFSSLKFQIRPPLCI